jgi:hydrogenase expression/formation protein HypC
MCLAVPGKIKELKGTRAIIDYDGITREADISLIEEPKVDEWVIVHVGFAIQKVDENLARDSYKLLGDEINELS